MRILIADSDSSQLKAYRDMTTELFGFLQKAVGELNIQYCISGSEMSSLLKANTYDLTIMDRALTGIPGDTIITLNRPKLGKIIVCSAFTQTNEVCISKPIDYDKLKKTIKEVCNVPDISTDKTISEYEVIR